LGRDLRDPISGRSQYWPDATISPPWSSRSKATTAASAAASTDIIEASALAYINAVNAIQTRKERGHVREVVGRPGAGA